VQSICLRNPIANYEHTINLKTMLAMRVRNLLKPKLWLRVILNKKPIEIIRVNQGSETHKKETRHCSYETHQRPSSHQSNETHWIHTSHSICETHKMIASHRINENQIRPTSHTGAETQYILNESVLN
jgi:hypothetical protein